jgi:hypothetical protein
MRFRDRIVVSEIDAVAGHNEALVREIDVRALARMLPG